MIPADQISPFEIMFRHIDDDGTQTLYAVERLTKLCREKNIVPEVIPVDMEFVNFCLEHRGIEPHRLARLTTEICSRPLLMCTQSDGSQLIVDGHHRYVRIGIDGGKQALAWILPERVWRPYTVAGTQDRDRAELLGSFSGLR